MSFIIVQQWHSIDNQANQAKKHNEEVFDELVRQSAAQKMSHNRIGK